MAERRMFAKTIIDSDAFLDMPLSTQALYFHLSMRADDDGFINNPKKITKMVGCNEDDLKLLIAKKFVICFESGIVVIKHWKIHNYIQSDRYRPTVYKEEAKQLDLKANKAYSLRLDTECLQDGYILDTQDRLGKVSLDKVSLGKVIDNNKAASATVYFPNDEKLNQTFLDYIEMRKSIKAKMTDRAIELAIKKLEKLSCGDNDKAIAIIEQSIMNSWKGLFEVKEYGNTKKGIDWDNI